MPKENGPPATSFSPSATCKMGAMRKRCGGFTRWAVRYMVLDRNERVFMYYHTPKDSSPKRIIDFKTKNVLVARAEPMESDNHPGFKLTVVGERDFIFIGTNPAVIDDWIATVAQTLAGNPIALAGAPMEMGMTQVNLQPMGGPAALPRSNTGQMPPNEYAAGGGGGPYGPPGRNLMIGSNPSQVGRTFNTNTGISTHASARSDQATLVGGGDGDVNSTLVHGQQGGRRDGSGNIVPYLTLVPDNKRFPTMEYPIVGIVKVGRFLGNSAHKDEVMFTFKSKVISRYHAEVWSVGNDVYLRDTRSQSGTFLNAMRLSEPGKESKPYKLKTGDIIQFGVDYKGATDDNSRCITVRVDIRLHTEGGGNGGGMVREDGIGGETLVNGNNTAESMTLVGQSSVNTEQTLFGAGQSQNGTAISNNSNSGVFAPVIGPVPPKRGLPSPGGGFNTQPRMPPGGVYDGGMMENPGFVQTTAFRPPLGIPNRAMMRPPMAGM